MKHLIYADNAATTQLDDAAFEAMIPWLKEEYGNASQPYSFARKPKKALAEAREIIANAINASPSEIYFTSGGTESDNWAIKGFMTGAANNSTLITSEIEHHAVLNTAKAIEEQGYSVVYLKPDSHGVVTASTLKGVIDDNARLVSVMLANNEIGTIEPIKDLSEIAHQHNALFHTDAVQAVGHIHIDVKELGVDMLSASAHKFNGPKGVGFLYIKQGTNINSFNHGGAQEQGFRAGTENIAGIIGMAIALQVNNLRMQEDMKHVSRLEDELLRLIEDLDFVRNGAEQHLPGSISLSFKGEEGETLLHRMDLNGICLSTGSACDSVNTQVSHVIRAIGVPEEFANGTIRISLGKNNTYEDVKNIALALRSVLKG